MAEEADRLSLAFVLEQASYVFPAGEPGRLSAQASSQLVTLLNWAMSPHVKRLNLAFVLVDEKLADLSDRLTANPHVAATRGAAARRGRTREVPPVAPDSGAQGLETFSDFDAAQLGEAHRRHLAHRSQRARQVGA